MTAGRALVVQSGGCTSVMNASLVGILREAHRRGIGVLGSHQGIRGLLKDQLHDLTATDLDLKAVRITPAALLGSARHKLSDDELGTVLEKLRKLGVRYFHVIGGNDSADTGHRLAQAAEHASFDLRVVVIPKTVDNDLPETDHTLGYGSAARFIAQATMDVGRDTEAISSVDPIKLIEIGGRDAGWLTAAAGLGRRDEHDAPHLIYTPERPFSLSGFLDDVQRTYDRLGRAVIALAEAVRDEHGNYVQADATGLYTDSFGHKQLGGAASLLCAEIADRLQLKAKFDKPGAIPRMLTACHSPVDLDEAEAAGAHAVALAANGTTNAMVTLTRESDSPYRIGFSHAPLERIANRVRELPAKYLTPDGHSVTPAFRAYAEPLIGSALPNYPRLAKLWLRGS